MWRSRAARASSRIGKQKPKSRAAAYYNRGNAHSAKGDQAGAIADYDEAIKLEPKNARAFNNRGTAHSDKGEFDAAIEDFDAAIKPNARLRPRISTAPTPMRAKGEADRAIDDYTTAIKHNRRNVNAYIARGALHLAGGAAAKAQADMKLAARLERQATPTRCCGRTSRSGAASRRACSRAARGSRMSR